MPYINVKISTKLSPEVSMQLKEDFGEAISIFPGKSEAWLMLELEDDRNLYFKGDNSLPCAFVEVKLLGSTDYATSEKFTERACEILEQHLNIVPSRVYVRYTTGTLWGWNGGNF